MLTELIEVMSSKWWDPESSSGVEQKLPFRHQDTLGECEFQG